VDDAIFTQSWIKIYYTEQSFFFLQFIEQFSVVVVEISLIILKSCFPVQICEKQQWKVGLTSFTYCVE